MPLLWIEFPTKSLSLITKRIYLVEVPGETRTLAIIDDIDMSHWISVSLHHQQRGGRWVSLNYNKWSTGDREMS